MAFLVESLIIYEREKPSKVTKSIFDRINYNMKKKAVMWTGKRALAAACATKPDLCPTRVNSGTTTTEYLP